MIPHDEWEIPSRSTAPQPPALLVPRDFLRPARTTRDSSLRRWRRAGSHPPPRDCSSPSTPSFAMRPTTLIDRLPSGSEWRGVSVGDSSAGRVVAGEPRTPWRSGYRADGSAHGCGGQVWHAESRARGRAHFALGCLSRRGGDRARRRPDRLLIPRSASGRIRPHPAATGAGRFRLLA
jgi:hypothetical protein